MTTSLRFITGLRYRKDTLEMLNNMTYIYDPNWNQNNSAKVTLPTCFFHVKGIHETFTSDVSQKQMLFYNSDTPATEADPRSDSGLLNVVADNIVIKPKTYKLDVVIPYRNLSLLDQSFVYNVHTANCVNEALINSSSSDENKILATYYTSANPSMKLYKAIFSAIMGTEVATSFDDWLGNILHKPDFNKESLETMWRMRRIVKMKMWNSWDYKYVSIVDVDITKDGTEDGVYEATLTLQEMPIVSMYGYRNETRTAYQRKSTFLEARGKLLIALLNEAGGIGGSTLFDYSNSEE